MEVRVVFSIIVDVSMEVWVVVVVVIALVVVVAAILSRVNISRLILAD